MRILLWRCMCVCVLCWSAKSKWDCVYIGHPCVSATVHTYVREKKTFCKHPSFCCNSTFLKHISTFSPSFVAAWHDAFSLLLFQEKNNTEKKRWDHWPTANKMKTQSSGAVQRESVVRRGRDMDRYHAEWLWILESGVRENIPAFIIRLKKWCIGEGKGKKRRWSRVPLTSMLLWWNWNYKT